MEIAVRPHIAAGVALLGAGVIAVSPMAPPVPDIHLPSISTAANNLVALTSPLHLGDAYNQVLQAAITNIQALITNVADDPTPILSQMVANQATSLSTLAEALQTAGGAAATTLTTQVPALLQTALGQLSASNISGAVNTLLQIPLAVAAPALGLLPALQQIITTPITNLVKVIQAVTDPINAPLTLVGFIAPLISMTGATGVAFQSVVDALGTGDIQKVANAVLTAPATIADGLLNGGYGPDLGPLVGQPVSVFAGGLLSMGELVIGGPTGFFIKTAGPLGALEFLRTTIANALKPTPKTPAAALTAKTDPAALPSASAPTIGLPAGEAPTDTKPATTPTAGATPAADPTAAAPVTDTPPAKADDATQTAPAATDPVADKGDEGSTTATPAKSDDTTSATPVKTTKPVDTTPSSTTPVTDKGETTGTTPAGSTDTKSGNETKPTTKAGNDAGKSDDGSAAGKSSDNAGGAATKSAGTGEKHAGAKHAAKHGGGK
jgi:hypothetical protein